jgi:thiamine biosynthesis lipoprotein
VRKKFLFPLLSIFACTVIKAQDSLHPDQVFARASIEQKTILMIFSGSDWCLPCIQLDKTIFSDTTFLHFAGKRLILLRVDFPQRKKLSPDEKAKNEKLADEFNPRGTFPLLLLVNPKRLVIASLNYERYTVNSFVQEIKDALEMAGKKEYKAAARLMGSSFEFAVSAESQKEGDFFLKECIGEVSRIENLLSEFKASSETSRINQAACGESVPVSEETYQLLRRSLQISNLTDGAFDISAGPLKKLYQFKQTALEWPAKQKIKDALSLTGYKKILLESDHKVRLASKGMHISFAAIGKGYAADKVKSMMKARGVESGMVNASGDLTVWGIRPNGKDWKAGIADPDNTNAIRWWMTLNGLSIATSGNYEQFFEWNGDRYSHNIDPGTGLPVKGIKSVSIISPAAELSDALATAVTVMGVEKGIWLIDQLPQTHCIIIDDKNRSIHSKKIELHLKNA